MNLPAKLPLTTGTKVFLTAAVIIGSANAIDFLFYGFEARNLLAALGFALMGYGVYKLGFGKSRATPQGAVAPDRGGRHALVAGLALGMTSMVVDYLQ